MDGKLYLIERVNERTDSRYYAEHLPLTVWFWAICLTARDKRGISAVQLSRKLEISYSSAWYLLHRLRRAMGQEIKITSFPAS